MEQLICKNTCALWPRMQFQGQCEPQHDTPAWRVDWSPTTHPWHQESGDSFQGFLLMKESRIRVSQPI